MDQGQTVQVAPTDAELQRAIASVPGVTSADIDRSVATGQSRMRLRLAPGEDEEAVAWSVAATLRERFGITLDPGAIRPRRVGSVVPEGHPVRAVADLDGVAGVVGLAQPLDDARSMAADGVRAGAAASGPEADAELWSRTAIPRAAIRDLQVHRDAGSVQVVVVLGHGDRAEEGRATSVPTSHGTLRAVSEATVAALRGLTEGPLLVGIDRVSATQGEDSPVATVVLSLLTRRGEERLLGGSIIYDSPERAVLRATLDALNRRVMPLLLDRDAGSDI